LQAIAPHPVELEKEILFLKNQNGIGLNFKIFNFLLKPCILPPALHLIACPASNRLPSYLT
jgi:hypothetical protein